MCTCYLIEPPPLFPRLNFHHVDGSYNGGPPPYVIGRAYSTCVPLSLPPPSVLTLRIVIVARLRALYLHKNSHNAACCLCFAECGYVLHVGNMTTDDPRLVPSQLKVLKVTYTDHHIRKRSFQLDENLYSMSLFSITVCLCVFFIHSLEYLLNWSTRSLLSINKYIKPLDDVITATRFF